MNFDDLKESLGNIFDEAARIQDRCLNGDRNAMRQALDSCKTSKSPIPDWLWRSLDASCKGTKAIFP
jgi:hypothetical protein